MWIQNISFQMSTGKMIELHEFSELGAQILTGARLTVFQYTYFKKIYFFRTIVLERNKFVLTEQFEWFGIIFMLKSWRPHTNRPRKIRKNVRMIKLFAVFDVFGSNGEFVCTIFANFASFLFLIIFEIAKIAKFQEIMDFATFWNHKQHFDILEFLWLFAVSILLGESGNFILELFNLKLCIVSFFIDFFNFNYWDLTI